MKESRLGHGCQIKLEISADTSNWMNTDTPLIFFVQSFPPFLLRIEAIETITAHSKYTSMKCVTNLNNQSEMIIFESLLITVDLSLFQLVNCKVGILTHYQGLWHSQTMLMFDRLMLNDKWYNFNFISEEETTSV